MGEPETRSTVENNNGSKGDDSTLLGTESDFALQTTNKGAILSYCFVSSGSVASIARSLSDPSNVLSSPFDPSLLFSTVDLVSGLCGISTVPSLLALNNWIHSEAFWAHTSESMFTTTSVIASDTAFLYSS